MTQKELAAHLGVNRASLKAWESGRYIPDPTETQMNLLEWLSEDVPTHSISLDEVNRKIIWNERLRRGMSRGELAGRLGVDERSLRDWERGIKSPQHSHLKALREWLEEEDVDLLATQNPLTEWLASNFGERLRGRRREWEMSESELAEHLGINKATLRSWENDIHLPDGTRMTRLWEWLTEDPPIKSIRIDAIDGNLIKNERLRRGIFQDELADRLGVAKASVIGWELGHRIPRHSNLKALREWLEEEDIDPLATENPLNAWLDSDFGERLSPNPPKGWRYSSGMGDEWQRGAMVRTGLRVDGSGGGLSAVAWRPCAVCGRWQGEMAGRGRS